MASVYKSFTSNDITNTRTLLHESIPITGSIISGTYASDANIKSFSHGMFQSVYDYPYLSSSANHIFDISLGVSPAWASYSSVTNQQAKKGAIYNQMAQVLVGFDETGSVRKFDQDGDLTAGDKIDGAFVISLSRLLSKDEVKKGTFSMELAVTGTYSAPASFANRIIITDSGAATTYRVNSPAGEYGVLYASNSAGSCFASASQQAGGASAQPVGLIYYQAGVVVLNTLELFYNSANGGILSSSMTAGSVSGSGANFTTIATAQTIDSGSAFLRNRIYNISFNNTTELNSTVYFCRVNHNEFNYSANPTYLTGSQIRVKTRRTDPPVAYITSVGMYSADRELLAVAKLSEPLRKDPSNELTLRVRLDY
jgi:hypothetical protein